MCVFDGTSDSFDDCRVIHGGEEVGCVTIGGCLLHIGGGSRCEGSPVVVVGVGVGVGRGVILSLSPSLLSIL